MWIVPKSFDREADAGQVVAVIVDADAFGRVHAFKLGRGEPLDGNIDGGAGAGVQGCRDRAIAREVGRIYHVEAVELGAQDGDAQRVRPVPELAGELFGCAVGAAGDDRDSIRQFRSQVAGQRQRVPRMVLEQIGAGGKLIGVSGGECDQGGIDFWRFVVPRTCSLNTVLCLR